MAITITRQPTNFTAAVGMVVSFSVEAEGEGLTYLWQRRYNANAAWGSDFAGASKTNSISFTAAAYQSGYGYRCIITDANGESVTTDTVELTIVPIVITKQPTSKAGFVGDTVTIPVEAAGEGLTYQWQKRNDANAAWENSYADSATMDAITFTVAAHQNGYSYRCKITDVGGNVVYTIVVTLTVLDMTSANGLVSSETLTAIADAIRAKTGTTDKILPANMAAMIEAMAAGANVHWGTVVPTISGPALYLGVELPTYAHYGVFALPTSGTRSGGFTLNTADGVTGAAIGMSEVNTVNLIIRRYDASNPCIVDSNGTNHFYAYSGQTYAWVYFEIKED